MRQAPLAEPSAEHVIQGVEVSAGEDREDRRWMTHDHCLGVGNCFHQWAWRPLGVGNRFFRALQGCPPAVMEARAQLPLHLGMKICDAAVQHDLPQEPLVLRHRRLLRNFYVLARRDRLGAGAQNLRAILSCKLRSTQSEYVGELIPVVDTKAYGTVSCGSYITPLRHPPLLLPPAS